jgi:metacaspase-1
MKKALLIGLSYAPLYFLPSSMNDLADCYSTLLSKGFTSFNILMNSSATKQNILQGLQNLINDAVPGDSLFVYFTGHGSNCPDVSGDEPDAMDEILVSNDFWAGQYLLDDDIRSVLSTLPSGVILDEVHDCCYSGTSTRAPVPNKIRSKILPKSYFSGFSPKYVPSPVEFKTSKTVTSVVDLNHCLWAACRDNQIAYYGRVGGASRSFFSWILFKTIRDLPSSATRDSIISAVQFRAGSIQTPQLECTVANSGRAMFM